MLCQKSNREAAAERRLAFSMSTLATLPADADFFVDLHDFSDHANSTEFVFGLAACSGSHSGTQLTVVQQSL